MAEKKSNEKQDSEGLGIFRVRGRGFIQRDPEAVFEATHPINGKTIEGKWTRALLSSSTNELLDELVEEKIVCRFVEVADVDVGIVTGANKYFLVNDETVNSFGLRNWAYPMFGRSNHCPGIIYDEYQHSVNASKGKPTNFIWFQDSSTEDSEIVRNYVQHGESESLHLRYKCRIRRPWYSVPSVYATEIGLLKRSHDAPRLILNKLKAFTTDTAYRVRPKKGTAEQLVFGFLNSLTALSAEIEGRHYGGGVLELIPSEIEKLLVPVPSSVQPRVANLDRVVRETSMQTVLAKQSESILGSMGLSENCQQELMFGWLCLRNRRQRITTEPA